jgi:hypothetical protein
MKMIPICAIILCIILSSCDREGSTISINEKCNKSICLRYYLPDNIQSGVPIELLVELSIKADSPELQLGINTAQEIESNNFTRIQDGQKPSTTNGRDMGWILDAKAGEIYTFSGTVIFPQPPKGKIGQYWISIGVVGPRTSHLSVLPTIILNSEGEQMSPDELDRTNPVPVDIGTVPPVVTDNPGMEFPISPTEWQATQQRLLLITPTPTVTITPTAPGYPAP